MSSAKNDIMILTDFHVITDKVSKIHSKFLPKEPKSLPFENPAEVTLIHGCMKQLHYSKLIMAAYSVLSTEN